MIRPDRRQIPPSAPSVLSAALLSGGVEARSPGGADHPQPKEQTNGKSEEENRTEESQGRPHAAEGPRKMNYTLTQAIDRTKDLSGIIKAADEMERLTADTLGAKEHEVTLARQAHDKAIAAASALRDEREALAVHIAALVRCVGEAPPLAIEDGPAPEMIVVTTSMDYAAAATSHASDLWNPIIEGADFQAQALQNGLSRITEAYERST